MWVKSGFCATFWSSKWDVTWPLEAPAKEEAIEFIVTLDQTQQVRWVALRLLKLSAWIRFDDMREKLCTLLFWRNNHVFFVTWKNMYVFYIYIYIIYQLCIQVIHHFFANKNPRYLYIELIRCSCCSEPWLTQAELAQIIQILAWIGVYGVKKHRVRWFRNPTSHGESTIFCCGQVKKNWTSRWNGGDFSPFKKPCYLNTFAPGQNLTWDFSFTWMMDPNQ